MRCVSWLRDSTTMTSHQFLSICAEILSNSDLKRQRHQGFFHPMKHGFSLCVNHDILTNHLRLWTPESSQQIEIQLRPRLLQWCIQPNCIRFESSLKQTVAGRNVGVRCVYALSEMKYCPARTAVRKWHPGSSGAAVLSTRNWLLDITFPLSIEGTNLLCSQKKLQCLQGCFFFSR